MAVRTLPSTLPRQPEPAELVGRSDRRTARRSASNDASGALFFCMASASRVYREREEVSATITPDGSFRAVSIPDKIPFVLRGVGAAMIRELLGRAQGWRSETARHSTQVAAARFQDATISIESLRQP